MSVIGETMNLTNCNLNELLYLARYTEYRKLALIEIHDRLIECEGDWK